MAQKFYFLHGGAYDAIVITSADNENVAVYFTDDGSADFPHNAEEASRYDVSEIIGLEADQMEDYRHGTNCGVIDDFDPNADEWFEGESRMTEYTPA